MQAQLKEMGADERLMSNGGHTSKTLREYWMTSAMASDESDKCVWADSEYTPYGGKKKDRKFSYSWLGLDFDRGPWRNHARCAQLRAQAGTCLLSYLTHPSPRHWRGCGQIWAV